MAAIKTTKKPAKEKADLEETGSNVTIRRTAEHTLFYADGVRLSISAYDVKLIFSVNETFPNNDIQITEIATIAISPLHAKELAEKLTYNVARYEREFMPLTVNQEYKDLRDKNIKRIYKLNGGEIIDDEEEG